MSKRNFRFNSNTYAQHVGLKGHSSKNVFYTDDDRAHFLKCMQHACEEYEVHLLVYALMDNHVHMILYGEIDQFQFVFESLGATFARLQNQQAGDTGAFWTQRYHNETINSQSQFLRTAAYIFNNPVKAGMCKNPEEFEWSNYAELKAGEGGKAREIIDEIANVEKVLDYTISEKDRKMTNREAMELALIEKKRVLDPDLYMIASKYVHPYQVKMLDKQDTKLQEKFVKEMWEYGANIHQISRVTHISRHKVTKIVESL